MSEERARILQMISEGKITAAEGARLLDALRSAQSTQREAQERSASTKWFRVRVTDVGTGRVKVNVNLPLSLVNVATKMGARFSPDLEDFDWNELMRAIKEGASGKLVEVEDDEGGERVEVFVE
ncbi:MAG: hypothetical protein JW934_08815 [Anaerolineae bacterium]|nr:hypothetical protein [Anaerolineae bacterium]